MTLKDRIQGYENTTNFKLTKKLPVIITLNGRSFRKTTSLLQKPYSSEFVEAMCAAIIKLSSHLDGVMFAYSYNDQIILVLRNDQSLETEAWCDNNVQKMVSISSSIASLAFKTTVEANNIKLVGEPIFAASTFIVPSITEAVNVLIEKQQEAYYSAIAMSCYYELAKIFNPDLIPQIIANKTIEEKYKMLHEKCGINFSDYPLSFVRGVACYRVPKVITTANGGEIKNKLTIDIELPFFAKNQEFLYDILGYKK